MTNLYERETLEFQPVSVTLDDVEITTNVEFAVLLGNARPVELDWATPTTLDDRIGVMVDSLTPGTYAVWARITSTPEVPVIDCGRFRVT
jgi:hypothetical protein